MPGSHVPVALGDGGGHGQIAVLAVHVVGAGAGVVPGEQMIIMHERFRKKLAISTRETAQGPNIRINMN